MTAEQIDELLSPFSVSLTTQQLDQLAAYLALLLKWNARTNLTAVRDPEEMVKRHFGESLFAARLLFTRPEEAAGSLFDVGSGAGFPGLPIAIFAPQVQVTLAESQNKKATFLKEVVRHLKLTNVSVKNVRAETMTQTADVVTLRAVESFETVLPVAARLVCAGGRLALLIGEEQLAKAKGLLPDFQWSEPQPIPLSRNRIVALGRRGS